MKKILILYYSRSGNTEKMAKAVAEGAQTGNVEVELNYHVEPKELENYDAIVIGAPTYKADMPIDFKNLFNEAADQGVSLKGKLAAVFGSYGWSGEAPQLVVEILQKHGLQVVGVPLKAKYAPDQTMLEACRDLGRKVSESLMNSA